MITSVEFWGFPISDDSMMTDFISILILIILVGILFVLLKEPLEVSNSRRWQDICNDLATTHCFKLERDRYGTAISLLGNISNFSVRGEMLLLGGNEAIPPVLDLRLSISPVGELKIGSYQTGNQPSSRIHMFKKYLINRPTISELTENDIFLKSNSESILEEINDLNIYKLGLVDQELFIRKRGLEYDFDDLNQLMALLIDLGEKINLINSRKSYVQPVAESQKTA